MFDLNRYKTANGYLIPSGIHYITSPIRISGEHIHIKGEDGAILRGTYPLSCSDFTQEGSGVWTATLPYKADAFYVGTRKYTMARYPKANRPREVFDGYAADCIYPSKTAEWADPSGGYIHVLQDSEWCGSSYRIEGKNYDGTLILTGGWQNNVDQDMHREYRYAENIREEMADDGEWFFDEKQMKLYARVYESDDLDQAEISISKGFFVFENCKDVTVENLTFERSVRTFMETAEPQLRSDWSIYRGGAILMRNCTDCTIDRCNFLDIGSNAVFADGKNEQINITRSRFSSIGASGICFVGNPEAVRSPLFQFFDSLPLDKIDKEEGPRCDKYPKNCLVEDCLIEHVGFAEKQVAGINISMSFGVCVRNCTICHSARAGINISEGAFGGHCIEGCDVFDTVRETSDHGSFNAWGRDRFWHVPDLDPNETGKYARLDILAPILIKRNRFRCDRGWDIDLDDGATDYVITENLCLNGGIKLREGFFRTVRNNITVNNTLHAHDWYPQSGDIIENNIFCTGYLPYAMPEIWGRRIDGNILHKSGQSEPIPAKKLASVSGQDRNSICLDAKFIAPAEGNFIPGNKLIQGFETFPTEFGVRFAPLRAIADTPILPAVQEATEDVTSVQMTINGMTVKNIETDGEMSLYATSRHRGAIVLEVEEGSQAYARGILPGDVIVQWGDDAIEDVDDLIGRTFLATTIITILRKQKPTML